MQFGGSSYKTDIYCSKIILRQQVQLRDVTDIQDETDYISDDINKNKNQKNSKIKSVNRCWPHIRSSHQALV